MLTNISRRALLAGLSCIIAGPAAGHHRPGHSRGGPPSREPVAEDSEPVSDTAEPTPVASRANAIHSDAFVEAIVINTHLNWRRTEWGNTAWRQPLIDLGVRYIRTMMGTIAGARDDLAYLYNKAGIRACVLVSPFKSDETTKPIFDNTLTQNCINYIRDQIGPEKVVAIEGPNEPNKGKTDGWEIRVRDHQKWMYDYVKAQSKLAHLPVVAPSIYKRRVEDYAEIGDLTGMADITNLHYYTPGTKPTEGLKGTTPAPMDSVIADAQAMVPGKPVWVTEYGHQVRDDESLWSAFYLSPLASAKYGLRGMAEFFRRGLRSIHWYTLFDDLSQNDNQFGLLALSETAYMEPRLSYHAMKRLIALMADPGSPFAPSSLAYQLSGDLTDVRHILFQKRDGRYLLMIWQDATSWDRRTASDIDVPPRAVTLDLANSVRSITAYAPTIGTDRTILSTWTYSAQMSVPDHVLIVEITP